MPGVDAEELADVGVATPDSAVLKLKAEMLKETAGAA